MQILESKLNPNAKHSEVSLAPLGILIISFSRRLYFIRVILHCSLAVMSLVCLINSNLSILTLLVVTFVVLLAICLSFYKLAPINQPSSLSFDGKQWLYFSGGNSTTLGDLKAARLWGECVFLTFKPQHQSLHLLLMRDAVGLSEFKSLRRWLLLHFREVR